MNQPSLPFSGPSSPERGVVRISGRLALDVRFLRKARARRYILRVAEDGPVLVTIPRGGSRREAETFVVRSRAWIERQRYLRSLDAARRLPWEARADVLVGGVRVPLSLEDADGHSRVRLGEAVLPLRGGSVKDAVQRHLRKRGVAELPVRLRALADQHGLAVRRVSVRNQRARWGSCGPDASISLNWRLVQMPPEVCDYVLLHELMHLRERNHSSRFWRLVEQACPGYREAKAWLKAHEKEL